MRFNKLLKYYGYLLAFILLSLSLAFYLKKTYNPTAFNWQKDMVTYLAKLTDIFYLPSQFKSNSLPVYYLYIKTQDYLTLTQSLPDPKKTRGVLPDENKVYVPAQIKYQDQVYQVQVRYRGYDFDHWTREKKSIKIKFDQFNPAFNQSELDLIIPEDRGVYLEALSNFRAKKLGLTTPDSQFINLILNDNNQGVYWQVDSLNQDFLSKNNLPLGQLYKDIDQPNDQPKQSIYSSPSFFKQSLKLDNNQPNQDHQLTQLLDLLNQDDDQLFYKQLPKILDLNNFLTWQAHSVLMGSTHQDTYHNIRLYFNPELNKFTVIPWDVLGGANWPKDYNPLVTRVLTNPDWLEQRNAILLNYQSNPDNLKQDLAYYDQLFTQTKTAFYQDTLKFFSNYGYLKQVTKTRQQLIDQLNIINKQL
jgi:hypothetical protein